MPFETYAALLNLKKILPSSKSNYVAVDRDYWIAAFSVKIMDVDLDEKWYLNRYPDVANAIADGVVVSGKEHYCHSGYFEHRMPYKIEVSSNWYLNENPDVLAAIRQKVYNSAQEHFEEIGYREGRYPFPGFALKKIDERNKLDYQSTEV